MKIDLGECSRTTCHNGGKCIKEYTSSGVNRFCNCSGPYTGRLDFIMSKSIPDRNQYCSVGMGRLGLLRAMESRASWAQIVHVLLCSFSQSYSPQLC